MLLLISQTAIDKQKHNGVGGLIWSKNIFPVKKAQAVGGIA